MGTTTVKWVGGQQYVGIDSTSHSMVMSSMKEDVGIKPSDLLPIAAAACTAVDVVMILEKKRMPLTHLEIISSAVQDEDPPWTFRSVHLHFRLAGKNLTQQAAEQAVHLAEEKYCSVAATIRATAKITTDVEIVN